jgi:hypothetical protein
MKAKWNKVGNIVWGYGSAIFLGACLIRANYMTSTQVAYLGAFLVVGGCMLNFLSRE